MDARSGMFMEAVGGGGEEELGGFALLPHSLGIGEVEEWPTITSGEDRW